jgi:hypothetical protein
VSISGENTNVEGDSMGAFQLLGSLKDGNRSTMGMLEISCGYARVPESTMGDPRIAAQPTQRSPTNSERCVGFYWHLMKGMRG